MVQGGYTDSCSNEAAECGSGSEQKCCTPMVRPVRARKCESAENPGLLGQIINRLAVTSVYQQSGLVGQADK